MDIDTIMNLVNNDNNLSSEQKQELNQAENKQKLEKLLSSVAGSAIGLVVAKFNDLSKTTQVLLTLLGFGLGSVIYDYDKY
jgi:Na+-transporting NADH:ubiquinone oxidoreductase subunit NqrC